MIDLKKLEVTLFLLNWEESDDKAFDAYKTWKNGFDLLWLVHGNSKQSEPYLVFCNNATQIYTQDWVNIYNDADLYNCLGQEHE